MPRARIPIQRADWDAFHAGSVLPVGVSRATMYRRAQQEGWAVPDPMPHTVRVENQITPADQRQVLGEMKIRLEFLAANRDATDQQVLRIISKLRCNLESWIEGVIRRGKLIPPKAMTYITRVLVNLEKLEKHRQDWIAKVYEKTRRVVIIERVVRERPPDPHEMLEADSAESVSGGAANIPMPPGVQ